jgi:hypothetical protein
MDFLLYPENSNVNTLKMNILLTGTDDDVQSLYSQIPKRKVVVNERTSPPLTYSSKNRSISKPQKTLSK